MTPKTKAFFLLTSVVFLSACVSKSRYRELESQQAKTQGQLVNSRAKVRDLSARLGVESEARMELEGSVDEMTQALEELAARKRETEKRLSEFRELTAKFQSLVDAGKLSVKVVNGRMVVALSTDVLFASGSARLSKEGIAAIREVTQTLSDIENKNYQIEGHTDNVPIKTARFASNWDLAAARAMTVLQTMLDAGLSAERVSAASYGENLPIQPNSSAEGRAANRRIEIVLQPDLSALPGFEELKSASENGTVPMPAPKNSRAADEAAEG